MSEEINNLLSQYTYRCFWSEEDKEFIAECLEFPLLSWMHVDRSEANSGIRAVVKKCLQDMMANGEQIPEPYRHASISGKNFFIRPDVYKRLMINSYIDHMEVNELIGKVLKAAT
jgi:predicted RNase H-like HicB family nuclease